jgi:hypothetical protein
MKHWKEIIFSLVTCGIIALATWASANIRLVPVLENRIDNQDAKFLTQEATIRSIDDKTTKILLLLAGERDGRKYCR